MNCCSSNTVRRSRKVPPAPLQQGPTSTDLVPTERLDNSNGTTGDFSAVQRAADQKLVAPRRMSRPESGSYYATAAADLRARNEALKPSCFALDANRAEIFDLQNAKGRRYSAHEGEDMLALLAPMRTKTTPLESSLKDWSGLPDGSEVHATASLDSETGSTDSGANSGDGKSSRRNRTGAPDSKEEAGASATDSNDYERQQSATDDAARDQPTGARRSCTVPSPGSSRRVARAPGVTKSTVASNTRASEFRHRNDKSSIKGPRDDFHHRNKSKSSYTASRASKCPAASLAAGKVGPTASPAASLRSSSSMSITGHQQQPSPPTIYLHSPRNSARDMLVHLQGMHPKRHTTASSRSKLDAETRAPRVGSRGPGAPELIESLSEEASPISCRDKASRRSRKVKPHSVEKVKAIKQATEKQKKPTEEILKSPADNLCRRPTEEPQGKPPNRSRKQPAIIEKAHESYRSARKMPQQLDSRAVLKPRNLEGLTERFEESGEARQGHGETGAAFRRIRCAKIDNIEAASTRTRCNSEKSHRQKHRHEKRRQSKHLQSKDCHYCGRRDSYCSSYCCCSDDGCTITTVSTTCRQSSCSSCSYCNGGAQALWQFPNKTYSYNLSTTCEYCG